MTSARTRGQAETRGRRASSTAASTGPPNSAPSRTALPPIGLGTSQSTVDASR